MNNKLYENIKQELLAIPKEEVNPDLIRALFKKYTDENANDQVDYFTTLYVFYEYMDGNPVFSFIRKGEWEDYFKKAFSSCFVNTDLDRFVSSIVYIPNVLNVIIKQCDDSVKKDIYYVLASKSELSSDETYKYALKELEDYLLTNNIISEKEIYKEESKPEPDFDSFFNSFKKEEPKVQLELSEVAKLHDTTNDEQEKTNIYVDNEIIPDIGINKEVTAPVKQTYVPNVASSSNIVQTLTKDRYAKLKTRLFKNKTKSYIIEYNSLKEAAGSSLGNKIVALDSASFRDIVKNIYVQKVLECVVPSWQQNSILSNISLKIYTDSYAQEKVNT